MKKWLPYFLALIALAVLGFIVIWGAKYQPHTFNNRITLRQYDKIPYGTFAAQKMITGLFPGAAISISKNEPGDWQTQTGAGEAVICIAKSFNADEAELDALLEFVRKGNYVFIIAKTLSVKANEAFNCTDNSASFDDYYGVDEDSLRVNLERPPFNLAKTFIYPGKKYESYFSAIDSAKTIVLGRTKDNKPNFIQMNAGKGSLFIHLAPLAFSNYFILHKNNFQYFQNALSVIPPGVKKVTWNEYYLVKPERTAGEPDLYRVLFQYRAFKWALLTALFTAMIYVLIEMRRRQRLIPAYPNPKNESLDFVKTLGLLYYDRGDHKNLAKKMSVYFLEHIRSRFKISTQIADEAFATALHAKSGYPLEPLQKIVFFINHLDHDQIGGEQLFSFYKQLEQFYKNT